MSSGPLQTIPGPSQDHPRGGETGSGAEKVVLQVMVQVRVQAASCAIAIQRSLVELLGCFAGIILFFIDMNTYVYRYRDRERKGRILQKQILREILHPQ